VSEQPEGPRDGKEAVDDLEEKHVHPPQDGDKGAAPDVKGPDAPESEPSEASSTSASSEPPD